MGNRKAIGKKGNGKFGNFPVAVVLCESICKVSFEIYARKRTFEVLPFL